MWERLLVPTCANPSLDLYSLLDDSHQPPVARWGSMTGTCHQDEGKADVGHLEEEAYEPHFLPPSTQGRKPRPLGMVNRMTR